MQFGFFDYTILSIVGVYVIVLGVEFVRGFRKHRLRKKLEASFPIPAGSENLFSEPLASVLSVITEKCDPIGLQNQINAKLSFEYRPNAINNSDSAWVDGIDGDDGPDTVFVDDDEDWKTILIQEKQYLETLRQGDA